MENKDLPAYPVTYSDSDNHSNGLSKRELIAAMALQGLLANPDVKFRTTTENFARISVEVTDALLLELSKTQT